MHPIRLIIIFFLIAFLLLGGGIYLFNQVAQSPENPSTNQLKIATSIFPLTDIARQIGQNKIEVIQLLPSGASPHTYALSPQQLSDLKDSAILFSIGHNLDTWATKAAVASNVPVITVDQNIILKSFEEDHAHEEDEDHEEDEASHTEDGLDPHYWLSVPNGQEIARNITTELKQLDPANATVYDNNLNNYLNQLNVLENELQFLANSASQRHFVTIHNAWSYLAAQYNFELVATYQPSEGQAPTLSSLEHLQETITEHEITNFYTEPQLQSSAGVRLVENELNLSIKILDPIGGLDNRQSFADLLRFNITQLAQ
jgi:zinc transport system substrate-binding protein